MAGTNVVARRTGNRTKPQKSHKAKFTEQKDGPRTQDYGLAGILRDKINRPNLRVFCFWYIILTASVIVSAYLFGPLLRKRFQPQVDHFPQYEQMYLEHIRAKYPSQTQRFWKIVNYSIKQLLTENIDTYPVDLLLVIHKDDSATGIRISEDINKSLNTFYFLINLERYFSHSLDPKPPGKKKFDLHDKASGTKLKNDKQMTEKNGYYVSDLSKFTRGETPRLAGTINMDHIENCPDKVALDWMPFSYYGLRGDIVPYTSADIILGMHFNPNIPSQDLVYRKSVTVCVIKNIPNDLWDLTLIEMPTFNKQIAKRVAVVEPEPNVEYK